MTQYFNCQYTPPNPKVPGSPGVTTAFYTGANPPKLAPGQLVGKPVEYDTATGCAILSMTNQDKSPGSYQVPMTKQQAQSLGTELLYANIHGNGLVACYTGGIVASNFGKWPQGPTSLLTHAPTSPTFAKAFVNMANQWIANPFPKNARNIDKVNGYTMVQLGTLAVMGIACAPLDWVFGIVALAIIIAPDSDGDMVNGTNVIGPLGGGGLTPPIMTPYSVDWGNGFDWSLYDDLGDLGDQSNGQANQQWDDGGQWDQ